MNSLETKLKYIFYISETILKKYPNKWKLSYLLELFFERRRHEEI